MKQYDVIIIGAGVSGCAVARELSRRERRIAVLERANDVCEGTSKANSGIVHAGHDAMPGTLKANLNVLGNEKMELFARELDFPFRRNGSLVLCFKESDLGKLAELKARGEENGVKGLEILTSEQVWEKEPNVAKGIAGALYAPMGGIVCPFGMNIALAENAATNGVEFFFNHEVTDIRKGTCTVKTEDNSSYKEGTVKENVSESPLKSMVTEEKPGKIYVDQQQDFTEAGGYVITSGSETFYAPIVINAAGIYADTIHNMVSENKLHITPRRGEYCLMDKNCGDMVSHTIFQLPTSRGKGTLVTPTVHGNLLVGPTAEDVSDRESMETTATGITKVLEQGAKSVLTLNSRQTITSFAGLRAHLDSDTSGKSDFVIGEVQDAKGFFDVAGIESPGLSCTPAIGEYVAEMVNAAYPAPEKENFIATRKAIPSMAEATDEERKALIASNPAYANVICRCELVTEGEIIEAIHRPVGATTLDGVKRRTRAGMGRCQSGFCSPKTLEILARELGVDQSEICKAGLKSEILTGYTKETFADSCAEHDTDNGKKIKSDITGGNRI